MHIEFLKIVLDYFVITGLTWILYLMWLVPFQLFYVKMDMPMFKKWIIVGTIAEMIFTYPIVKFMIWSGPQISDWINNLG